MLEIDLEQTSHEASDLFKKLVVFPAVTNEIKSIRGSGQIKTLHIGEGSGQIAGYLTECNISEANLVDINSRILRAASERFETFGIRTNSFSQDACEPLPLEPGTIDVAIALFSLNQIKYPEVIFDLINYYLSSRGRFIVVVPDEAFIVDRSRKIKNKLSVPVNGVLERLRTTFNFKRNSTSVNFFARPNTDYVDYMNATGFIGVTQKRLEDVQDISLKKTPKAFMMVGRKMPVKFEDNNGNHVSVTSDEFIQGRLVAVESNDEFPYLKLNIKLNDGRGISEIPFPKSENAKKIIKMALSVKKPNILTRHIIMKDSSSKEKHIFRIFSNSKRIAYYSMEITD